jgi:glutamate-1-semialdehyde 2,1-aminomutase
LAAALATMRVYEDEPVIQHLHRQGERLARGVAQAVQASHLEGYFGVEGRACNLVYYTRDENKRPSQPLRTLFLQEVIKRGILGPSFVVSYTHTDHDIDQTIEAVAAALQVYARALDEGVSKFLIGPASKPVMRRYC